MSQNPIIIYPIFGLGNRLSALASGIKMTNELNRPLKVCWSISEKDFNSKFEFIFQNQFDYIDESELSKFTQLEGYVDIRHKKDIYTKEEIPEETFYIRHCHWFNLDPPIYDFRKEMSCFKPIPEIQNRIDYFLNKYDFRSMVGIHIRKTDKVWGNKRVINYIDEKYIEVMKNIKDVNFFVASDENIDVYKNIFGNRIITAEIKSINRNVSGLMGAVLDMWLLAHTKYIIRGPGTFALCASTIHGIQNINIFKGKDLFYEL
jgi:hypothetical protein